MKNISWTLNLFGISLNFLAGILLAPEAVGRERISKVEKHIRHSLVRIIMKLESFQLKVIKAEKVIGDINIPLFFSELRRRWRMPF